MLLKHGPDDGRSGFGDAGGGFHRRGQGVERRMRQGGETTDEDDQSADERLDTIEMSVETAVDGRASRGGDERGDGGNPVQGGGRDAVEAVLNVTVDVRDDLKETAVE